MNNYIKTAICGIISGIFSGCLGIGSTTLFFPFLLLFNIVPNFATAVGTTLVSSPFSYSAVYEYYLHKEVYFVIGLIYVAFYVIFSFVGAIIHHMIGPNILFFVTGILYVLLSIFYFYYSYSYNLSS